MNIKHLLPAAALLTAAVAYGRPADPGLQTLENPDGTTIQAYFFGDENFHYIASANDGTIIDRNAKGYWAPVIRAGRALTNVESDLAILRAELPQAPASVTGRRAPARMADHNSEGRTSFPTIGEVHSPVVLIEYADTPFSIPNTKEQYEKMLNEPGYSDYGGRGSVRDYFTACSNGKFTPKFDVYGPVKVSHNKAYYVGKGSGMSGDGTNAFFGYAIKEALEKLHADGVDFTQYDYDKNGVIDNVYFFYSGKGQADSGDKDAVWPHQGVWERYYFIPGEPNVGNIKFDCYACSNELKGNSPLSGPNVVMDGIGAFAHEFSHVLGLADLYDATAQSSGSGSQTKVPGVWSNMSSGTYNMQSTCPPLMSAWEMWQCWWLEFDEAELKTHYEIPALGTQDSSEDNKAVRVRIRRQAPTAQYIKNEYYVVEARSNNNNWDAGLPGEGILIWHVNYSKTDWSWNQVNSYRGSNFEIMNVISGDYQPYPTETINGVYPGMSGELRPNTMTSRFNGFVTDMTYSSEDAIATFDYGMFDALPEDRTVLHDTPVIGPGRSFTLEWDAVEDPDAEYLLTVRRTDSRGNMFTVNGLLDKSVGKECTYTVSNLTSTAWDQKFTASVRVAKRTPQGLTLIPANYSSNVIEFVPSQVSGILEIEDLASAVTAGKGFINAPEGAEIFSLSGVRTGSADLPAGVYIVRVGSKSVKVNVR